MKVINKLYAEERGKPASDDPTLIVRSTDTEPETVELEYDGRRFFVHGESLIRAVRNVLGTTNF